MECGTANPSRKIAGAAAAIAAALMWGVSGTLAQFLFTRKAVSPVGLVEIRLLSAGLILLAVGAIRHGRAVFAPWRTRRDALELIAFGVGGLLAVQYTFFAAIAASNAATATVLQYLSPVVIVGYVALRHRRRPRASELVATALALTGTFAIVTHGDPAALSITPAALGWGLASAAALAAYSILPARLTRLYPAATVVGWGMAVGGVAVALITPPARLAAEWDATALAVTAGVILLGTTFAFVAYVFALERVGPTTANLLACAEPLAATLIAVLWLGVRFETPDWLGTCTIIAAVVVLTRA